VFDTFANEEGRLARDGERCSVAQRRIEKVDLLAAKLPG
jgi:hypothetical protein